MRFFHGTDLASARRIEAEGLREGAHVTDSLHWAKHYARRSAGAAQSAGAILAVDVPGYVGYLRGGPIDPDAIGSAVWRCARTLPAVIVGQVAREQRVMPEDAQWYGAIRTARAFERQRITDPRHGSRPL
jgi:hypothetical protein